MTPKLNIPELLRKHVAKEGHGAQVRLQQAVGVGRMAVHRWLTGEAYPSGRNAITIVEYLRAKKLEEQAKKNDQHQATASDGRPQV